MAIDVNRGTSGVVLPPQVSTQIWATTQEQSGVMRAAQQMPLPGEGIQVPIITGDPTASWVGETDEIGVSRPSLANKTIQGYKLAVIVPFSNEFRRDLATLFQVLVSRLPLALARKFDTTVFGLPAGAPGSNFDTLGAAASIGIGGKAYSGLLAAQTAIATGTADGDLTGWILSPAGRSVVQGQLDTAGKPIFFPNALGPNNVPDIFGAPVYSSRAVYAADADGPGSGTDKQYGYAGDWTQAYWGNVQDIEIAILNEATIKDTDGSLLHLAQRDMFAVRAKMTVGFAVRDLSYFAKLTSATQS